MLNIAFSANTTYWIGIEVASQADCNNGTYRWYDGTPVNYTSWYANGYSPYCGYMNPLSGPYACGYMWPTESIWYTNNYCNQAYYGALCEKRKSNGIYALWLFPSSTNIFCILHCCSAHTCTYSALLCIGLAVIIDTHNNLQCIMHGHSNYDTHCV